MISQLISWLDAEVWRYWLVALGATVVWLLTLPFDRLGRQSRATVVNALAWPLATFALLIAWRWPYLVGPAILNPDEAQMIAGAITLKSYPVFWKYVDGTTHGPLVDLSLLVTHAFGAPLNYGGARLTAGLLVLGGWIFAGRALMLFYPAPAVRIGLAPVMLLWASIAFFDFAGYTSEQVPIFLLLASLWPLSAAYVRRDLPAKSRNVLLALAGLMLGSLPYAKLQSVPIGLTVGAIAVAAFLWQTDQAWSQRLIRVGWVTLGALTPTVVIAIYLWIWGLIPQFWHAYILNNRAYASITPFTWKQMFQDLWNFIGYPPGLMSLLWISVGLLIGAFAWVGYSERRRRSWPWIATRRVPFMRLKDAWMGWSPSGRFWLIATFIIGASCLYATLAPRRPFGHYLQFVGIPLGMLSAISIGEAWRQLGRRWSWQQSTAVGALLIAMCIPLVIARATRPGPDMFGLWTKNRGEWRYPASIEIAKFARSGDTMSIWGWMPYFYVETGLPHATREAHTERQIQGGPMFSFYRDRYLRDFTRRPPRIFVDAVGGKNFAYDEKQRYLAHESFPPLAEIIARDYTLVATVDGSRIYLRRE